MSKYIALVVSLFSVYLSVCSANLWLISVSVLGYFLVIIAFILVATSGPRNVAGQSLQEDRVLLTEPQNQLAEAIFES